MNNHHVKLFFIIIIEKKSIYYTKCATCTISKHDKIRQINEMKMMCEHMWDPVMSNI